MANEDVRWKQRFTNFRNAVSNLQAALLTEEPNILERQGLIRAFELCYELAWKTPQDYLRHLGYVEATLMAYSLHPIVRHMAATGLTAPMIEKIQSIIANDPRDAAKWREELEEQLFPWSVDVVPITTQTEPAVLNPIRRVGIAVVERPAED